MVYALLASPDPRSRVVEAAHFVQYGTLALLAFFSLQGLSPVARWAQALLFVVAVGLVDELIQWALATRFAEIRDVAVNAAAGVFGLLFAGFVLRKGASGEGKHFLPTRGEFRMLAVSAALVLPVVAAFMYFVHLGYSIRWDKVEFVSRYRAAELDRTGEERRARWSTLSADERADLLRPAENFWGIEDFYVTEARRHIQARNHAAETGDTHAASGENRIVERWYTPYLELARARRLDLPKDLERVYRSNVLSHLWPWLGSRSVWGAFIAAEMVLVGLALRMGSTP